MAGSVHFHNVYGAGRGDFLAGIASVAGFKLAIFAVAAIGCLGQKASGGGFAYAARPRKKIRVGQLIIFDLVGGFDWCIDICFSL
jgi:hypothetical protein